MTIGLAPLETTLLAADRWRVRVTWVVLGAGPAGVGCRV